MLVFLLLGRLIKTLKLPKKPDNNLAQASNANKRTTQTSYEKLWPFARLVSQAAIRYLCGPQRAKVSQGLQISSQCRMGSRYVGFDNRIGNKDLAAANSFTTSTMRDHKWLYVVRVFCPEALGVCTLMLVVQIVRKQPHHAANEEP